jgi:hypothetical protein
MASHTTPEYSKRYAELNREKIAEAKKLDYQNNREKIIERQRNWYNANKEKRALHAKKYREANKEKEAAAQKRWREANPEKVAASLARLKATPAYKMRKLNERLRKFGITGVQYAAMVTAQDNKCGACRNDKPAPGSTKRWAVDHCHTSGRVRGLLSQSCNLTLGNKSDNVATLEALIVYLKKFATNTELGAT